MQRLPREPRRRRRQPEERARPRRRSFCRPAEDGAHEVLLRLRQAARHLYDKGSTLSSTGASRASGYAHGLLLLGLPSTIGASRGVARSRKSQNPLVDAMHARGRSTPASGYPVVARLSPARTAGRVLSAVVWVRRDPPPECSGPLDEWGRARLSWFPLTATCSSSPGSCGLEVSRTPPPRGEVRRCVPPSLWPGRASPPVHVINADSALAGLAA